MGRSLVRRLVDVVKLSTCSFESFPPTNNGNFHRIVDLESSQLQLDPAV
jgi:hypothetical protein